MTNIFRSIKTKFLYFIALIALLFIVIFILQYNNYFFTLKTLQYDTKINQAIIIPGNLELLQSSFLHNDIIKENFYTSEKSKSLDSIFLLIDSYKNNLDSLVSSGYLSLSPKTRIKIRILQKDCDKLKNKYIALKQDILDRGFLTTGKSGEWARFGTYLESLAGSQNNSSLVKNIVNINKQKNAYQYNKSTEQIQMLLDQINALIISLNVKTEDCSVGISETDRLKFIKELESFASLTSAIHKLDIKLGFVGGEGLLGEISLSSGIIKDQSANIYDSIKKDINDKTLTDFYRKTLLIILLAFIYMLNIARFSQVLYRGISQIKNFVSDLLLGKLPSPIILTVKSELNDIAILLNNFVASLHEKIRYATKLGSGQTDSILVPLSDDDTLANAMLDMEKRLKTATEEDKKYKVEEQKRTWANEGLAKFGEILRMQTNNLAQLSDEIIINLVKYLKADLGGIFLYNDDDKTNIHLELISAFAYDRKKFISKRVELGEGLVGTCAQEKQTILVTDIPQNYIEISSGLGDAPPRCILIIPLKTEENIFGILEIASFHILQPFEIDFVEKLTQSIATTFGTVKININTARLLEQSKKQTEEMAQQEEELRQNLEELQATQEESARREAEINSLANAVDGSALVIQCDMEGHVIEINKKFSSVIKLHRDEIIGRYLKNIFIFNSEKDEFYNLLRDLKQGKIITRNEEIHPEDGHNVYIEMHYSPISDHDGNPYKVLGIATNITGYKLLEKNLKTKEEELTELDVSFNHYKDIIREGFIVCELSAEGLINEVNEHYSEITGYHIEEVLHKDYRKFLRPDELKQFEVIWNEVMKDKFYKGVLKRTKPTGEENWLMTSLIPFKDSKGIIRKVFFLAQDITEKRLKYQVLEDANKEIERLKGLQNQV
jgi:PAS domain S-box-containing protein